MNLHHARADPFGCGRGAFRTMVRLRTLPPRLGMQRPSVVALPEGERARDRARSTKETRQWYNSPRWRELRLTVFKRDGFTCQRTGELLTGKSPAPNSPVADHIIPHQGDPVLFWDPANIETVSKAYHDSVKQRAEATARAGGRTRQGG
jgi:5-methylcytosine-specific restriction enzyme A